MRCVPRAALPSSIISQRHQFVSERVRLEDFTRQCSESSLCLGKFVFWKLIVISVLRILSV